MAKKKAPQEEQAVVENAPPLRLEWRSPAELAENPRNWRTHPEGQIAALTDVISEVGWAGACLLNERTGRLIDGHARKKVALDQGADKVPVLVGNWSEEQEAKILATLDPLAAMAECNKDALDSLMRDVQTSSESLGKMLTDLAEQHGIVPGMQDGTGTNDINEIYQGMPEYVQADEAPKYTIHVHFESVEDMLNFGKLLGQEVNEKTKFLWHPQKEKAAVKEFTAEDGSNES